MTREDFLTIEGAAHALGVSTRHARRLADDGSITKFARGLVDRSSVDRYLMSQRQGRTRAWAQHTAWGAIALLAGEDTTWLGETQRSRLRGALRGLDDASELLTRCRDRARVETFAAHRAALPRLRDTLAVTNLAQLGLVGGADDHLDGYIAADELNDTVRSLGLQTDSDGTVVLRVTAFDFETVRQLAATKVVAALDAATSLDPRVRGVGRRALEEIVGSYR